MAKRKIIALYKEPCGEVERITVENTLGAFQALVHGYIECVPYSSGPHGERRILIVNEEGKLMRMAPNFKLNEPPFDLIVGPAVWVGWDGSEEFIDIDPYLFAELVDFLG